MKKCPVTIIHAILGSKTNNSTSRSSDDLLDTENVLISAQPENKERVHINSTKSHKVALPIFANEYKQY